MGTPTFRETKPNIDPATVHQQCDRILADPIFKNSKRSSDLLRYIVDRTLEGRNDCLKERIIGIEVLGRSPDYDTNQDASVRGAIGDVRKRLVRYFENPEHQTELHISLPAGSYVVEFTPFHLSTIPLQEPAATPKKSRKLLMLIPLIIAVFIAAVWATRSFMWPTPAVDRFWSPALTSTGPVLIAIGSGVAIPGNQPSNRVSNDQPSGISISQFIARQTNFPMAELNSANSIDSYLAKHGRRSTIQLASSTTLSDLHQAPVVLLGSYLNQWTMRLGGNLHFQFQKDGTDRLHWIEDTTDPTNRNWEFNLDAPYDQVKDEYALVTRELDPNTGQWWIGIGGLSVLGTIAGERALVDPETMAALDAQLPKGWDRKNLQIVMEIRLVNGSPGASRAVASYVW